MPVEMRPALNPEEVSQAINLLDRAFPNTPQSYFANYLKADRTLSLHDTFLALDNGKIVCTVQRFPRHMRIRRQSQPICGIGNVATHPDYRGEGLASDLMGHVLNDSRNHGFCLALLFTRIPGFFLSLGFLPVDRNEFYIEPVAEAVRGEVARFDPLADIDPVKALYREFCSERTGTLARSDAYWQGQLDFAADDPNLFVLLRRSGQLVAYLRSHLKKDILRVMEFAYRESMYDIFSLAGHVARANRAQRIRLPLMQPELLQAPNPIPVGADMEDTLMVHLLDLEDLVSRFTLWDDAPKTIVETLFGPGEFTFWQTDFF